MEYNIKFSIENEDEEVVGQGSASLDKGRMENVLGLSVIHHDIAETEFYGVLRGFDAHLKEEERKAFWAEDNEEGDE